MGRDYSTAYFFTTGNRAQGLGHLYRCLNLASALRPKLECHFFYHDVPDVFYRILQKEHIRANATTHRRMLALQQELFRQVIVIDGIELSADDVAAWRERGNVVVCIDDAWKPYYACDLVIAHGPHRYHGQPSGIDECRFLIGPEHALINPAFYQNRRDWTADVQHVFINFGGTDPLDFTGFILGQPCLKAYQCHVVLGADYRGKADDIARFNPKIHVYEKLTQVELAGLMAQCDVAIGSGGGLSLELCAVGLPALLVAVADDQVEPCKAFDAKGMALYAGNIVAVTPGVFHDAFTAFVAATDTRCKISHTTRTMLRRPGVNVVAQNIHEIVNAKKHVAEPLVFA